MKSSESSPQDLALALRIACWGGTLVLAIGYAVLLPMKWHGMLPREMTWVRITLGPALLVGYLPALIQAATRCPNKTNLCLWIVTIAMGAIALIVCLLDPVG